MRSTKAHKLPEPYEGTEIDVTAVVNGRTGERRGYSVGVMDTQVGQGHRYSLEYAEALATTMLKAIRAHKRRIAREKASDDEQQQ
jgi:hypothetical protein